MRAELAEELTGSLSAWNRQSKIFLIGRLEDVGLAA